MHQQNVVINMLEEIKRLGRLTEKLSDSLLLLATKRTTLEEKIISQNFLLLGTQLSLLQNNCFQLLSNTKDIPNKNILTDLQEVNSKLEEIIDDFLKMAHYNANFLEQYYEHDFLNKFIEDQTILVALQKITEHLELLSAN